LFEVLKAVNVSQSVEVDQAVRNFLMLHLLLHVQSPNLLLLLMQILDTHNKVEEKQKLYVPYNILPLDPDSTKQPIMQFPEVPSISLKITHQLFNY
jgi:callose synthase